MGDAFTCALPAPRWPAWYTPSKHRPKLNARVQRGVHPFGLALGREDRTCGDCGYRSTHRAGQKRWGKCALVQGGGGGLATDCPAKWRACERWTLTADDELGCKMLAREAVATMDRAVVASWSRGMALDVLSVLGDSPEEQVLRDLLLERVA